jgi:hypothetical protein
VVTTVLQAEPNAKPGGRLRSSARPEGGRRSQEFLVRRCTTDAESHLLGLNVLPTDYASSDKGEN